MDYINAFKNTNILWLKDGTLLRFALIFLIFMFFSTLLMQGLQYVILGADYVQQSYSFSSFSDKMPVAIPNMIFFSILSFFIGIPIMLGYWYYSGAVESRALTVLGYIVPPFNPEVFLKYAIAQIWISMVAISSWYNKNLRIFFALLVLTLFPFILVLLMVPLLGGILLLAWFLAGIVYFFILIYNVVRLSVATSHFLANQGKGISKAVHESYGLTRGRALSVFIALVVCAIPLVVLYMLYLAGVFVLILSGQFAAFAASIIGLVVMSIVGAIFTTIFYSIISCMSPSIYHELLRSGAKVPSSNLPVAVKTAGIVLSSAATAPIKSSAGRRSRPAAKKSKPRKKA